MDEVERIARIINPEDWREYDKCASFFDRNQKWKGWDAALALKSYRKSVEPSLILAEKILKEIKGNDHE